MGEKSKRPVALFIDDAHALKDDTLTGLKRLMEVIESDGGCLSVVLSGPSCAMTCAARSWRKSVCGPIPSPSTASPAASANRSSGCCQPARRIRRVPTIIHPEAVDLLASRLRTPLQIEWHLTQALEGGPSNR